MFKIEELTRATGGELAGKVKIKGVTEVSIDSRKLKKGSAFVALRGAHFDGRDFIDEAISKGAKCIITPSKVDIDVLQIVVKDPVDALGDIASIWRDRFDIPTIAITGSNGKSTTKQMVSSALASLGPILQTEGNFNNLIGLPLTVLRWTGKHKAAVLEMGMNAPGEIARLTEIARPNVGLITNVSSAHLEKLHTIENVAKAKGELFENMPESATMVVNLEDPWAVKMADIRGGARYTFGMQNDADVRFGRMESRGLESIDMTLYVDGEEFKMHLKVPGAHNVMNALAAVALARVVGVGAEEAIKGIEKFEPMSMRMERIILSNGVQVINDSYNANPKSVKVALRTVSGAKRAGRFIAVLGDMLELGENASVCHEEIGEAVVEHNVDRLFAFGEHASSIEKGARAKGMNAGSVTISNDMDALKEEVFRFVKTGDIVLVKGSRGVKMERVIDHMIDEIGVE